MVTRRFGLVLVIAVACGGGGSGGGGQDAVEGAPDVTIDVLETTDPGPVDATPDVVEAVDAKPEVPPEVVPDSAEAVEVVPDATDQGPAEAEVVTPDAQDPGPEAEAIDVAPDSTPANYGFDIRLPQEHPDVGYPDQDYVCTFVYAPGSLNGYFYIQVTPTSCGAVMGGCDTKIDGSWVSIGGVVSAVQVTYEWNPPHHNDTIAVTYGDKVYTYGHSTIGYGAFHCMPPDCLSVTQGGSAVENGCTPARTLPVVCVLVNSDGTIPSLVDPDCKCPGDPNATETDTTCTFN